MKYVLILLLLAGCDVTNNHKSNEAIIVEAKKCTDAGMDYWIGDWSVVHCTRPKEVKK